MFVPPPAAGGVFPFDFLRITHGPRTHGFPARVRFDCVPVPRRTTAPILLILLILLAFVRSIHA